MTAGPARRLPVWLVIVTGVLVATGSAWVYHELAPLDTAFFQPSRLAVRGLLAYLRGDYARAGRLYRASYERPVTAEYPDDPYGAIALTAGDAETAERRARLTLTLVPNAVEPKITLAEIALDRRRLDEAVATLDEALARHPDHADAVYLSAIALARLGRHGEAIERLNRALVRGGVAGRPLVLWRIVELTGELGARPSQQRPLCLLAHLYRYIRIFDPSQAPTVLAYATAAIEANDRPADAWVSIGIARGKQGDVWGAAEAMQQAFAVNPRHADAAGWLAGDAAIRRDLVAQDRMVRVVFELRPTDPYFLPLVDELFFDRLGDPHTVVRLMERAVAIDPAYAPAHARLAEAAERLGNRQRAAAERAIVAELEAARRAREANE